MKDFSPSEQELKERGFNRHPGDGTWMLEIEAIHIDGYPRAVDVWFFPDSNKWDAYVFGIFPTSWDDIDTLIELLTPKE